MKKAVLLYLVLFVVSLVVFGCGDDDDGVKYYIRFNVNGEQIVLNAGYTNAGLDNVPFACVQSASSDTMISASLFSRGEAGSGKTNRCTLYFQGNTAGTYTETNAQFQYQGTNSRILESVVLSITVDNFGDVGGIVSGTFYGVISNTNLGAQQVTDGSFNLKRIADDAYLD